MKGTARTTLRLIGGRFAMRHLIAASLSSCSFSPLLAGADTCKPDVSTVDQITKQQKTIWTQALAVTGAGAAFMGSPSVSITIGVGRYGHSSAVSLEIFKEVSSGASASFDSSLRAVKGNLFFLGFKDGGEPLSFIATDVGNETKARNAILDFGNEKVVTSVLVLSTLSDSALTTMREALTTRPIDAIRVKLAGDLVFETSLDDKAGKKVMGRFTCFYEAMDMRQAATADPGIASANGRYLRRGANSDFLELSSDGLYSLRMVGKSFRGTYTVEADTITMTNPRGKKAPVQGHFSSDTITFTDGNVWDKQAEAPTVETQKADTTVTLRLGMTPEQVEAALGGRPQKVIDLGSKKTYVYPDMKIVFVDGKVTDIQ